MKRSLPAISLILSLFILLSLPSCSKNDDQTPSTNDKILTESYAAQLEYYISLAESLQNELLAEKEASFIAKCSYQLEIEQLKEDIISLKRKTVSNTVEPEVVPNASNDHSVVAKEFENTSLESPFTVEIINNKLTVSSYTGDEQEVEIPKRINGKAVKCIGDEAFKGSDAVKIIIPDGVEKIGWFAFSGCRSLREIVIPATVTSVEYGAFDYCSSSLVIICEKGSYIEAYAKSWGITVVTE